MSAGPRQIALSEVISGLSYALDLTEGEPPGHAVRSCMIGMRLAQELGLGAADRSRPLLRAAAQGRGLLGELGADGGAVRGRRPAGEAHAPSGWTGRAASRRSCGRCGRSRPAGRCARARCSCSRSSDEGEITRALMRARCERGAEIARLLGLGPGTAEAIRALDEHWDGAASPRGCAARRSRSRARILCLAQTVEIFHAARGARRGAGGWRARRSGGWFDPRAGRRAGARRAATRAFWRSLARGDAGAVGAARAAPDGRRGAPRPRSPTRSRAWSTRSRRGPTATPTARA